MAKLEGIKWVLESDDKKIKLDLMTNYSSMNDVTSFGQVFFDGVKQCDVKVTLPDVLFNKPRKPRSGNKLLAYALAYYLSMIIVNTCERQNGNAKGKHSKKAENLAMELLNLNEDSSIRLGRRKHKLLGRAKIIVSTEPLGIIVLLDEKNIVESNDGGLVYKGLMWGWRQGDSEAIDGYGEIKI